MHNTKNTKNTVTLYNLGTVLLTREITTLKNSQQFKTRHLLILISGDN